MTDAMQAKLALGTVQFGLAYGVAGATAPVPEAEVRAILRRAWALGVRTLDTAAAYGNIEQRLAALMDDLPFRVVSKIAPLPAGGDRDACVAAAVAAFETSRQRLGDRLDALLFHRAEDLAETHGDAVWAALAPRCADAGIALGVSCYDPATLRLLKARLPLALAQMPGSALDQRVDGLGVETGVPLHLRSAFLQGLLLMPEAQAARRVPAAAAAIRRWHAWCEEQQMQPLVGALAVVKSWPGIDCCVVGVDGLGHLEEVGQAWQVARPLPAPQLACAEPDIVDPRRWPAENKA